MEATDIVYCFSLFLLRDAHTIICNETHDAENTFKITFQRKSHLTDFISQLFSLLSVGNQPVLWHKTPLSPNAKLRKP